LKEEHNVRERNEDVEKREIHFSEVRRELTNQ